MLRRWLALFLISLGGVIYMAPSALASQLSVSSTITLVGVVLPGRYVYLDTSGDIQKVIGNTSQNINPTVLNKQNQVVGLSNKVARQYQQLLAGNGGHFQASQTYISDKYNPYILFARWVATNPYFSQKII